MIQLLLATSNATPFEEFAAALHASGEAAVQWAESGEQALKAAAAMPADLVVIDEQLRDMRGLTLAKKMLLVSPAINCAVVSALPADEFHEAGEGLGLLAQLAPRPGKAQATELLRQMNNIQKRLAETAQAAPPDCNHGG